MALSLLLAVAAGPANARVVLASGATSVPCSAAALVSAITAANASAGSDTISLASGCAYVLTSASNGHTGLPVIASQITVIGNGATITRARSAAAFRILSVASGASLSIRDVTISGGLADADCPQGTTAICGGGIANSGTLTIDSSTIRDNIARGVFRRSCTESNLACWAEAGGISNAGTATITDAEISDNLVDSSAGTAGNGAGGGLTGYGPVVLVSSLVTGNRVLGSGDAVGGGMDVEATGSLDMQDTQVSHNSVSAGGRFAGGGGLAVFDTVLRIARSVVAHNSVIGAGEQGIGGGILNRSDASISDTVIEDNVASNSGFYSEGGGITTVGIKGKLNLSQSQVIDNESVSSYAVCGGVCAQTGTISGTVIRGNVAQTNSSSFAGAGGVGVCGPVTISNSTVQDNESLAPNGDAWSAGIHLFRGCDTSLALVGTNVSGNIAHGYNARAGGIYVRPGTSATLDSSPVDGNSAIGTIEAFGGGIANSVDGSATLTDSPVINNTASGASARGGGLFDDGGLFVLDSSPVLHNEPDNCYPVGSIAGCVD